MTAKIIDLNYNGVFCEGKDTQMQTFSGVKVSILNPQPEQIFLSDIACATSKQCRFGGHCSDFYSVAQHCSLGAILCIDLFGKDVARDFLFHDATECYINDVIRPVKVQLGNVYREIEERFHQAIARRFNISTETSQSVKYMDEVMLMWEKRDLLPNSEDWPNLPDINHFNFPILKPWNWKTSEAVYIKMYNSLFSGQ